jgi:hypothetical protein
MRLQGESYADAEKERVLLEEFRERSATDRTLSAGIESLTRESVMSLKHLTREQKEALWRRIQKLQAEAKKIPAQPIFQDSYEE